MLASIPCLLVNSRIDMNLEKITLVILSHRRQQCLKQTLQFYGSTGINLLVLDNSPEPLNESFVPENCRYINVDEPFAQRSARAASLIETPYTIIGADDEVYLPSSLQIMQNFLDNNPDYVAVGGYAMAIWEYGPTIAASWAYQRTYQYHNNADTPLGRISRHTGEGKNPITSFFTCNLTRTSIVQECLRMYAKAPVLATDAISVLTICGAGKSKYLDVVYWVRNWNQSPRSHAGWNRQVFLHEWWVDPENCNAKNQFVMDLSSLYRKYSLDEDFSSAWNMILNSDQVLQKRVSLAKNRIRELGENTLLKTMKFHLKKYIRPHSLPKTVSDLSSAMMAKGILIPELEIKHATTLVSKLLPYDSWK